MPDAWPDYIAQMQRIGAQVAEAQTHAPKIGENGTWWLWDGERAAFVDSGIQARAEDRASGRLTDAVKAALLTIAEKAGYSDTHGQDYYDAL